MLGQSVIQFYTTLVSKLLPIPIDRQSLLTNDLQADPFVSHAMTTAACEQNYSCRFYTAPLTAAVTSMRYYQFDDLQIMDKTNGKSNSEHEQNNFD